MEELKLQMAFLKEVEKLKTVYRQNVVIDGTRSENSAEHSWHVALMAIILSGHAEASDLNILKVVTMLLIHDIVEIDAGDTFLYDEAANMDKQDREQRAAERIFGLLPAEQGQRLRELWQEFEECATPEARFAASLDGMQPVVNHYCTNGIGIRRKDLTRQQVIAKKQFIAEVAPQLWQYTLQTIEDSTDAGLYQRDADN